MRREILKSVLLFFFDSFNVWRGWGNVLLCFLFAFFCYFIFQSVFSRGVFYSSLFAGFSLRNPSSPLHQPPLPRSQYNTKKKEIKT